jgi:hypothetical protein
MPNDLVLVAGEESVLFGKLAFVQHTNSVSFHRLKLRAIRLSVDILTSADTAYCLYESLTG